MPNPRKPTDLKLVKGTLKRSRERPPLPASTDFPKQPPRHLKPEVAQVWREIVRNAPPGLLARSDAYLVEMAANLLAEFQADPAGMQAARLAQLQGCMRSLGMNPQARQTLNITPPPKPNEFDEF